MVRSALIVLLLCGLASCAKRSHFNDVFQIELPPSCEIMGDFYRNESTSRGSSIVYLGKFKMSELDFNTIANKLNLRKAGPFEGIISSGKDVGKWWDAPTPEVQLNHGNKYVSESGDLNIVFTRYGDFAYIMVQDFRK